MEGHTTRTRRPRLLAWAGLLLAWGGFAAWQSQSYRHERGLIDETLHQQSHSVMNALTGGMRSHRRLGRFFEEQIQGLINELVKSEDVLSVAVVSEEHRLRLTAGRADLLDLSPPIRLGDSWDPNGLRTAERFKIVPEERAGGSGGGRGLRWGQDDEGLGVLAEGAVFTTVLVLDRSRADTLGRRAAWSHVIVAVGGGLVLVFVALAWRTSVRLVAANGQARLLKTEARYLRELGQAAAGLAHETRNPLGLIRGWAQRLLDAFPNDPQRQEHTRAVIEECDRVTARINQFLAFARPCEPAPEKMDPGPLIDELTTILQPDLEAKGLKLLYQARAAPTQILADRELLRQALFNMLLNATYFSPEGDAVQVDVLPAQNGTYRIEVADRGPGVSEDAVPSLFTPYHTTRSGGTGLGLATVGRIAAAHGWETGYRPRPDGGSVFFINRIHD